MREVMTPATSSARRTDLRPRAAVLTSAALLIPALTAAVPARATAPAAAAAKACRPTITALPLLPNATGGQVIDGRGDNLLVGGVDRAGAPPIQPVLWSRTAHGWTVHDLGSNGRYPGFADGVDRRGDVLILGPRGAWVRTPRGVYHALRDFTGAPATNVFARQINRDGAIAGGTVDARGRFYGAVWSHYDAVPRNLRPLAVAGSVDSIAAGINNRGDAVGNSTVGSSDFAGGIWYAGRTRGHVLPGLGGSSHAAPFRINDAREIAGSAGNADFSRSGAAIWDRSRRLHYLGTLLRTHVDAGFFGLSAHGRAVGASSLDPAGKHSRVIYWPGHGPLRTLLPLTRNWAHADTRGHYVTDHGLVAGSSTDAAGVVQPTAWTCAGRQAFVPPRRHTASESRSPSGGNSLGRLASRVARIHP